MVDIPACPVSFRGVYIFAIFLLFMFYYGGPMGELDYCVRVAFLCFLKLIAFL